MLSQYIGIPTWLFYKLDTVWRKHEKIVFLLVSQSTCGGPFLSKREWHTSDINVNQKFCVAFLLAKRSLKHSYFESPYLIGRV